MVVRFAVDVGGAALIPAYACVVAYANPMESSRCPSCGPSPPSVAGVAGYYRMLQDVAGVAIEASNPGISAR